jgi:hypothetical protein
MNRLVLAWLTFFSAVAGAGSISDDAVNGPLLSAAHIERLSRFLASFSTIVPPVVERGRWGKHGALPTIALKFPHPHSGRAVYADSDAGDGTVYFFMSAAPYDEKSDHNEPMEKFLGARDAFEITVPLLRHLGLSTEMIEYQVVPDPGMPSNRAQGCWLIRRELKLDGIPCDKAWIEVYVRVSTKEIEVVSYRPPLPPRPIESRITEQEARSRVSEWLKTHWYFSTYARANVDEKQDITEMLVIPPEYKEARDIPEEPYLSSRCWAVPIRFCELGYEIPEERVPKARIPVEIDTGRILVTIP